MENNSQILKTDLVASVGLAIGAILGMSGSLFPEPLSLQASLYEISTLALMVATTLLFIKFLRRGQDYIASGFILFTIGEAAMSVGSPLGHDGVASFGAGLAIYVPALWLISTSKRFPLITRITGIAATIPFGIAGAKIFLGHEVSYTDPLPGMGYGLLVLTIIGWIYILNKKESPLLETKELTLVESRT